MRRIALIVAVAGIMAGTVWADPTYEYSSVPLGGGFFGHTFSVDNTGEDASVWFVEMEWHGDSGGEPPATEITQVLGGGWMVVNTEAYAILWDIYDENYDMDLDTWIRDEFCHAFQSGTPTEGANSYTVESGTGMAQYVTAPHAYIVSDGDVAFSGRLGVGAVDPVWTSVGGVSRTSGSNRVPPPLTSWTDHISTDDELNVNDIAFGIAVHADSGNSYITGRTGGQAPVVKYDSDGDELWTSPIGSTHAQGAYGIAVHSNGSSHIAGYTWGGLEGPSQGEQDAFIVKLDSDGEVDWVRQFGTDEADVARGIAMGETGHTYTTGSTRGDLFRENLGGSDAFIVKCDSDGDEVWTRQSGTSYHDVGKGIAVDSSGNSYITGYTEGGLGGVNAGGRDVFVIKYSAGGTEQWKKQIGSSHSEEATAIAVDATGDYVYITGFTEGDLGGETLSLDYNDVFIAKLDAEENGDVEWIRQIDSSVVTELHDEAYGIAVDISGNAYITGRTQGELVGPNQGNGDVFVIKYDSDGIVQWARMIGSSGGDTAYGIALDADGYSHITGWTGGDLGGPAMGLADIFVVAFGASATPGDANLDGCVDGLDYITWSNHYQEDDKWWQHGDFTGDGVVDGLDYVAWSNNYGEGCPPGLVPEPGALALLGLGALALLRRRRHKA